MRRRPVLRDARSRRLALIVLVVLPVVAAPMCLVRVARLWTTPVVAAPGGTAAGGGGGGGGDFRRLMFEHGTLVYESVQTPSGSPPGGSPGPILNYQFDPGLSAEYRITHRRTPAPGGVGMVITETRVIPLAVPMLLASAVVVLLIVPLRRVPTGECVCGYPLDGLTGERCPECAAPLPARADFAGRDER